MMCSASNPEQPPPHKDNHLLSLPEDIVLSCLARVPRNCNLNLTHVSKTLKTFVSSPELNRLRSLLHKSSLYVCFYEINDNTWTHRWLTIEKTTTEYRLVLFPCHPYPIKSRSSAVSVGPEIYFLSDDLWILDTRSGKFSQGPSLKPGFRSKAAGVIDEVLDPKSKIWKSEGQEKVQPRMWCDNMVRFASLERKVYMVEAGLISVYNPRKGEGERMDQMVSNRLAESNPREGRRKEKLGEAVSWVCVVENVLYACYCSSGLMWFDTKLNVWRRVVSRAEEVCHFGEKQAVAEYQGKLAVFEFVKHDLVDNTKSVKMFLFSFLTVGEKILGTIEWSGIVATVPYGSQFLHCFGM
ncbi:hypothetical protein HID58_015333 [Brassica napus]|uniref:F-box domain-containing protein n=1 Tax=Brassica napus TaxID=3708 RepID=A0ABQ8DJR5_BRANA|nr:hypothetical protein HID58_015333 [Brassica napus]